MDRIVSLKYAFYAAPLRINHTKEIHLDQETHPDNTIAEKDKWHEEWLFSYKEMPSIMKITIEFGKNQMNHTLDTHKMDFYFVLPSSKNPVHYPPGLIV